MAKRRKLTRGTVSIKQLEQCHIAGSTKISLPERPRKHFEGSSCGDTIVGLTMPDPEADSTWRLKWGLKKVLLGKKIWPAWGKTPQGDGNVQPAVAEKRTDDTMVPMCYGSMPDKFYAELLHMLFAKMVLDMSPGDEVFAFECIKHRVGYLGIAFTPEDAEALKSPFFELVRTAMRDPASPLYNDAFSKAFGGDCLPDPLASKAKAKGKPNGNAKAKAKAKAKPPAPEEGESEDGGDESDEVWDPLAAEETGN